MTVPEVASTGASPQGRPAVPATRVIAVFGDHAGSSLRIVHHVRQGARDIPVWLYATSPPPPELAALCGRVVVHRNSLRLVLAAQRELWPRRAALAAGAWTGKGGGRLLKLCPFAIPPFRSLFLNRSGDFLPGTPRRVAAHCGHRLRERAHEAAVRAGKSARTPGSS